MSYTHVYTHGYTNMHLAPVAEAFFAEGGDVLCLRAPVEIHAAVLRQHERHAGERLTDDRVELPDVAVLRRRVNV